MAIYHCSVKMIGRSAGRSSVAAAAYRSGECLTNEYDGIEHDYTNKNWVEFTEIMLPENAPEEYKDRSTLWNAVEMIEKSQDAQLAREFELALPVELSHEEQIEVLREFVRKNLTGKGMCADIAIHNPPVTNDRHQAVDEYGHVTRDVERMQFRNPHAHILCTVRPIDINGKWESKSKVEYLCKKGAEEQAFTAEEFKLACKAGWEKQYRYFDGKKKVYYTPSEAEEKELERVNRSPKTTPYGRKNETVERWNSKDRIFEWRQSWENMVNEKFRQKDMEIRVDSRSFIAQGREDEVPTMHMGVAAINIEKRAERELAEGKTEAEVKRSDIGEINRTIREHNQFVRELKKNWDKMIKKAKEFAEDIAKGLAAIRAKIIGNRYQESVLRKEIRVIESQLIPEMNGLEQLGLEISRLESANAASAACVQNWKEELKSCSILQTKKKNTLKQQIQEEQEKIENRVDYISQKMKQSGYYSQDEYIYAKKEMQKKHKGLTKMQEAAGCAGEEIKILEKEYRERVNQIPKEQRAEVNEEMERYEEPFEKTVRARIQERYGDKYDADVFENAKRETDNKISKEEMLERTLTRGVERNRYNRKLGMRAK